MKFTRVNHCLNCININRNRVYWFHDWYGRTMKYTCKKKDRNIYVIEDEIDCGNSCVNYKKSLVAIRFRTIEKKVIEQHLFTDGLHINHFRLE